MQLLAAEKAEAEKVSKEHATTLSLREDAIRELHLVRRAVEVRYSRHTAVVSQELDVEMTGLWDEFHAQCNELVEKAFQAVLHAAFESRVLQSRLDVGDDHELATATVVLNELQHHIPVPLSSSSNAGPSGGGGRDYAILLDDEAEAMSQDA